MYESECTGCLEEGSVGSKILLQRNLPFLEVVYGCRLTQFELCGCEIVVGCVCVFTDFKANLTF